MSGLYILKGLTADAADPDLVAFEHAFDTDHVSDRVIGPMIDRVIDRVIELDYAGAIVRRPLVRTRARARSPRFVARQRNESWRVASNKNK